MMFSESKRISYHMSVKCALLRERGEEIRAVSVFRDTNLTSVEFHYA
jgi:hypothetical protein